MTDSDYCVDCGRDSQMECGACGQPLCLECFFGEREGLCRACWETGTEHQDGLFATGEDEE